MSLSADYLEWEQFTQNYPNVHILQSSGWGRLKEHYGWNVSHLIEWNWGAQILVKQLGIFRFAYIPKGPVADEDHIERWIFNHDEEALGISITNRLREFCRKNRIVFVKLEPDLVAKQINVLGECPTGFTLSPHTIQPLRTILIDLQGDEAEILARMKQKTRYNIRLSERKGVMVEASHDLDLFYQMMVKTGKRDGFGVHTKDYYERAYRLFHDQGKCELFIATYQGAPIAGLMVFAEGKRAYYFYGASVDEYREVMAPYLLQWKAILWAREMGCVLYDLWGIPDYDVDELERQFEKRRGGLWGVYRFKRGFGGQVVRYYGAYDYVAMPLFYSFYRFYTRRKRVQA